MAAQVAESEWLLRQFGRIEQAVRARAQEQEAAVKEPSAEPPVSRAPTPVVEPPAQEEPIAVPRSPLVADLAAVPSSEAPAPTSGAARPVLTGASEASGWGRLRGPGGVPLGKGPVMELRKECPPDCLSDHGTEGGSDELEEEGAAQGVEEASVGAGDDDGDVDMDAGGAEGDVGDVGAGVDEMILEAAGHDGEPAEGAVPAPAVPHVFGERTPVQQQMDGRYHGEGLTTEQLKALYVLPVGIHNGRGSSNTTIGPASYTPEVQRMSPVDHPCEACVRSGRLCIARHWMTCSGCYAHKIKCSHTAEHQIMAEEHGMIVPTFRGVSPPVGQDIGFYEEQRELYAEFGLDVQPMDISKRVEATGSSAGVVGHLSRLGEAFPFPIAATGPVATSSARKRTAPGSTVPAKRRRVSVSGSPLASKSGSGAMLAAGPSTPVARRNVSKGKAKETPVTRRATFHEHLTVLTNYGRNSQFARVKEAADYMDRVAEEVDIVFAEDF